jgi:hypothetical protein
MTEKSEQERSWKRDWGRRTIGTGAIALGTGEGGVAKEVCTPIRENLALAGRTTTAHTATAIKQRLLE